MDKVSLSVVGADSEISDGEIAASLSKLYGRSEEHFTALCQCVLVQGKAYTLLKRTDQSVAEQHRARLEAIGLRCVVKPATDSNSLSLVPVEAAVAEMGVKCPACEELSTDTVVCSHCEVVMAKFERQQNIDVTLQTKLKSAESGYARVQLARQQDTQRLKSKKNTARPVDDTPETEVEDVFNARVEDSSKKVVPLALAATVLAAVAGGYFAYSLKNNPLSGIKEHQLVAAEIPETENAETDSSGGLAESIEDSIANTVFTRWSSQQYEIKQLKHKLDLLNANVGMSSTMHGLVANTQDPLSRNMGRQHLLLLEQLPVGENALRGGDQKFSDEKDQAIAGIVASIEELPRNLEKVSASIGLVETLHLAGHNGQAEETYIKAKGYLELVYTESGAVEKVLAQTIFAEHLNTRGDVDASRASFKAASQAAHNIDTDIPANRGAFAYIARREASIGQFADAHRTLSEVKNDAIRQVAMNEITEFARVAHSGNKGVESDVLLSSNEEMFADDPDLMLLFENDKKMQENAQRISTLRGHF